MGSIILDLIVYSIKAHSNFNFSLTDVHKPLNLSPFHHIVLDLGIVPIEIGTRDNIASKILSPKRLFK